MLILLFLLRKRRKSGINFSVLSKVSKSLNPFDEIVASMRPMFRSFERFLLSQASKFAPEIRSTAKEIISPKGKYIRPMLVFSSALSSADKADVIRRGAIVELTHLSTLVHDDVIDNATVRRNKQTPNSKYGARTAILLGDMIFAQMMILAFEDTDKRVADETTRSIRTICEGEVRQTLSDKTQIVSRKKYYEIAYGKTAALFELSCKLGAMAGKSSQEWIDVAGFVGKQLGIAYQIYDDICDWFMSEAEAGKTLGTDLVSGKQTFPLIVLLESFSASKAKAFVKQLPAMDFVQVRQMMLEHNVRTLCEKEFIRRITLAENALKDFPECAEKLLACCSALRKLRVAQ